MPNISKLVNLQPLCMVPSAETAQRLRGLITEEASDAQLYAALDQLPYHEQQVLIRYYALDGGNHLTLREIGEEVCLKPNRIRQVRVRAERRLREKLRRLQSNS